VAGKRSLSPLNFGIQVKSAVEGAIEDIASAAHIYRRALGKGVGMLVELGGRREA
jgi:hypothetical protein